MGRLEMPKQHKTRLYDVHYLFEAGYDATPILRAYELYKDVDGYNTDTDGIADRYEFTESDTAWLMANVMDFDNKPYTDLLDFWIDDWDRSDGTHLRGIMPPNALEWLDNLSPYLMADYTEEKE
jgi:hypothetical protein